MSNPGLILYEGPSKLDGKPIVVIATFNSKNEKTGNMVQTWILPQNVHPVKAVNSGYDKCVCSCNLRGKIVRKKLGRKNINRACYVVHGFAPSNVWKKYKTGQYYKLNSLTKQLLAGKNIRLGSYGDPAAVPAKIWANTLQSASGWTGYTANWRNGHNRHLRRYCQASVYSLSDAILAHNLGWHTFRISLDGKPTKIYDESVCLGSLKKTQCQFCLKCNGQNNVVTKVHGRKGIRKAFEQLIKHETETKE